MSHISTVAIAVASTLFLAAAAPGASAQQTVEGIVANSDVIVCDRRPGRCEGSVVLEPRDAASVPVTIKVVPGTQITEGGKHLVLPAINRRSVTITYVEEEGAKVATSIDVRPVP